MGPHTAPLTVVVVGQNCNRGERRAILSGMRRSLGWLVAAVIAAAARTAAAQPGDGLAWRTGDECGSVEALRTRIAVHLGRPLAATDAIHAAVEVVRAPLGGDVRAAVEIATRRGRAAREVHGADCAAVVDAVAFVLASAVSEDGAAVVADPPDPGDGEGFRSVPVEAPPPGRRERLAVQLGLDGWSDAGTLPTLQLGVGGSLALSRGRYRAEVGAAAWDERWTPLTSGGLGAGVSLRHLAVRGCYGVGPWKLWLCGGVLHGEMRSGSEFGAGPAQSWTAASFQTLWSRPIEGPVRVAASVEGLANLERPAFRVGSGGAIEHEPALFALRLSLGLAVVIW